jgi:hypothetical protein
MNKIGLLGQWLIEGLSLSWARHRENESGSDKPPAQCHVLASPFWTDPRVLFLWQGILRLLRPMFLFKRSWAPRGDHDQSGRSARLINIEVSHYLWVSAELLIFFLVPLLSFCAIHTAFWMSEIRPYRLKSVQKRSTGRALSAGTSTSIAFGVRHGRVPLWLFSERFQRYNVDGVCAGF